MVRNRVVEEVVDFWAGHIAFSWRLLIRRKSNSKLLIDGKGDRRGGLSTVGACKRNAKWKGARWIEGGRLGTDEERQAFKLHSRELRTKSSQSHACTKGSATTSPNLMTSIIHSDNQDDLPTWL